MTLAVSEHEHEIRPKRAGFPSEVSGVGPGSGPVAGAVVVLACLLGAVLVGWRGTIDDFWLTLASGRALHHGTPVAHAVPFTFTRMVPHSLNPQWGAQWLAGAVGLRGALVLSALGIGGGLLLTASRARRRASGAATAIAMLAVLVVTFPFLQPRPESWTALGFPLALVALERWRTRPWFPLAYGAGVAVWANLHGGFLLAEVAAASFLVGDVLERRRARPFVLAAALLGPLANPNGVRLLAYALGLGGNQAVRSLAAEWEHAGRQPWAMAFWTLLVVVAALRLRSRRRVDRAEAVLLFATAAMSVWAIRSVPWFALAAAPMLAEDVDGLIRHSRVVRPLSPRFARGMRVAVAAVFVLVLVFQAVRPSLPDAAANLRFGMPSAAVDRLAEVSGGRPGRVFAEQTWGGFVAERLGADRGAVSTFVDGRLEIQTMATWGEYKRILTGTADAPAELRSWGSHWVLVPPTRTRLLDSLAAAGWRLTTIDGAVLGEAPWR